MKYGCDAGPIVSVIIRLILMQNILPLIPFPFVTTNSRTNVSFSSSLQVEAPHWICEFQLMLESHEKQRTLARSRFYRTYQSTPSQMAKHRLVDRQILH
jgi:hypothetical protein